MMKILLISCLIIFSFQLTCSYPRLFQVLQKSHGVNENGLSNEAPLSNMVESEEDFVQERSWDSGEDHYFRWATNNRRPMESLVGRKRQAEELLSRRSNKDRIAHGLWRSGLVG